MVLAGCSGPKGPAGAAGPSGPSGPSGATGAAGQQGARGDVGPQGQQGVAGPQGLQGAAGPQGVQGPPGTQGPTGLKGLTWRGAWSPLVTYGADDAVEFGGSAWIALAASTGAQPPGPDWQLLAARGEAGAVGAIGPSGPSGPQGPQGASGPSGPQGALGLAGPAGPQGAQGVPGPAGAPGGAGPAGPQGPPGVAGAPGAKGLNWMGPWSAFLAYATDDVVETGGASYVALVAPVVGSMPPNGQWGLLAGRGEPGPQGLDGPQGPSGAPGPAGAAGPQGPPGPQGSSGVSVSAESVVAGDASCPAGGVRLTTAGGAYYVCNGVSSGQPGGTSATCGGVVTSLLSDPSNCGACGRVCASGLCSSGECERIVFVTSTTYSGNLGGLAGADEKCQARATAAGLGGQFKALLGTSAANAGLRMSKSNAPYVTAGGARIASGWSGLIDMGGLSFGSLQTEFGFSFYSQFWFGAQYRLDVSAYTCADWTDPTQQGSAGYVAPNYVCPSGGSCCLYGNPGCYANYYQVQGYSLGNAGTRGCSDLYSLLCIEQ